MSPDKSYDRLIQATKKIAEKSEEEYLNIFYLDHDPVKCAQMHCDKHIVKMIVEYAQMLSTAHRICDNSESELLYKKTHENHPCSVWTRASNINYNWLFSLLVGCINEYKFRYGKEHKTETLLKELKSCPKRIPRSRMFVVPPLCVPEEYHVKDNSILTYRNYYLKDKIRFAKWNKGRKPPYWWKVDADV